MNRFNVLEFGAVGDNRTDCTAAIQKALDAAALVEGEVIVPPGKYRTGRLKMGCRTRLTGNTCRCGVNDSLQGERSPGYGFILRNCDHVVVQSNTLLDGAVKQGIVYDGLGTNIVKDNLY